LLNARDAIEGAKSTKEVQERLHGWPWKHADISELEKSLKKG
jgi:hypothetical protein